ncbi:MAG TPA: ABC transporter ATP-binding protein [Allosphingosinicella sp.]|jgi:iron complex transport system ATP-binding protein
MNRLVEAVALGMRGRLSETSLVLDAGELVCLVGHNGSGKTSLLHAMAGIGPAQGEVRIGGENPRGLHPERRQRLLTFLPASRDVKWPLTGRDLIGLGLPSGTSIDRLARELDLLDLIDRRVDRLSTGERSRILIARALAAEPKLLLLDEPTANLDPLWQLKLMDHLRGLAGKEERAVLLAVHDLEVARRYADRLLVMSGGRVEADGDPQQLLSGPLMQRVFGISFGKGGWEPAP